MAEALAKRQLSMSRIHICPCKQTSFSMFFKDCNKAVSELRGCPVLRELEVPGRITFINLVWRSMPVDLSQLSEAGGFGAARIRDSRRAEVLSSSSIVGVSIKRSASSEGLDETFARPTLKKLVRSILLLGRTVEDRQARKLTLMHLFRIWITGQVCAWTF